jgi:Putative adhesin
MTTFDSVPVSKRSQAMTRLAVLVAGLVATATTAGCSDIGQRTDEQSYEVTEPVTSLVIDARAGTVDVATGEGPLTVTETYAYRNDKPRTSHEVNEGTLQLTETGCADDNFGCNVQYRIRVPAATAVTITTNAGAVELNDLDGDIRVTTDAGAVEARNLTGDRVSVQTDAGATSLHFREPPTAVQASTDLGAISVEVPRGTAYAVDTTTSVGGASVSVDRDPYQRRRYRGQAGVAAPARNGPLSR